MRKHNSISFDRAFTCIKNLRRIICELSNIRLHRVVGYNMQLWMRKNSSVGFLTAASCAPFFLVEEPNFYWTKMSRIMELTGFWKGRESDNTDQSSQFQPNWTGPLNRPNTAFTIRPFSVPAKYLRRPRVGVIVAVVSELSQSYLEVGFWSLQTNPIHLVAADGEGLEAEGREGQGQGRIFGRRRRRRQGGQGQGRQVRRWPRHLHLRQRYHVLFL